MRKALLGLLVLGMVGAIAFYVLTMPRAVPASALPAHTADVANGKYIFTAGGCAECHAAPAKKCGEPDIVSQDELAGGRCLKTPFGTFNVPNISPDKEAGIGNWSTIDFVNAMKLGIGPGGEHLYPAFPYSSYQHMTYEDLIDLKAYLDTLPAVKSDVPPHDLMFPFNIRRALGLWQLLYVDGKTIAPDATQSAELNRGTYLVRGPGHCTECHSSRNLIGGIVKSKEYAGAPNPDGKGSVRNITPSDDGIGDWTSQDLITFLKNGTKCNGDAVGENMVPVQENLAKLTTEDQTAIVAFLKALPPRPNASGKKKSEDDACDGGGGGDDY